MTLRETGVESLLKEAYSQPFARIAEQIIPLGDSCTPERFRFIDCQAVCNTNALRIVESAQSSPVDLEILPRYATISYVWKGNHNPPPSKSFNVKGGEDGDRILIDLLRITCAEVIRRGAQYLWLDRLCLIQESKLDKQYQIKNMSRIYSSCCICLVLPGGIGGFVKMEELTTWIERSWTLQELLLPKKVDILLKWEEEACKLRGTAFATTVIPHDGVIAIDFGAIPPLYENTSVVKRPAYKPSMIVFGEGRKRELMMLDSIRRKTSLPIGIADDDGCHISIWRMARNRISKKRIDVVLSIMALFGITLNPASYTDSKDDVLRATADLVKATMAKGHRADWLYASLTTTSLLPPLGEGRSENEPPNFWYLSDTPLGYVTDSGQLALTVEMAPTSLRLGTIQEVPSYVKLLNGQIAEIAAPRTSRNNESNIRPDKGNRGCSDSADNVWTPTMFLGLKGTHAIKIGNFKDYRMGYLPKKRITARVLLMLVEQGKGNNRNVWYKTGVAVVSNDFFLLTEWKSQDIIVG